MKKITNEKKMTTFKKKKSCNGVNTNKSEFKQEIFIFDQDEIYRVCWLNMKLRNGAKSQLL